VNKFNQLKSLSIHQHDKEASANSIANKINNKKKNNNQNNSDTDDIYNELGLEIDMNNHQLLNEQRVNQH
jgi:hypothetical protein